MPEPAGLDAFYSRERAELWRRIIGDELHYHFGYFEGDEDLATGLRRTVRELVAHVPSGASVLDVGCGWGAPARMLRDELRCAVHGLTVSRAQADHCVAQGLDVALVDVESQPVDGRFDVVFALESLEHVAGKRELLRRLRRNGGRLVLSTTCVRDGWEGDRAAFGGSIVFCTVSELLQAVTDAGWTIQSVRNRRFHSIPTLAFWRDNFERTFGERPPPGQLGVLRDLTETALRSLPAWCRSFPLIDVVADP
jgi:cyclopropane fatty-acyl-phospholipid synthase-like methyltransferase